MKLFRNKFVIGILCILAALALGFVALPALQRTGGQIVTVTAVRLKAPVSAGTRITADMLETVKAPHNLVQNDISDISQAVGRYARTDLYVGDYLTSNKTTTQASLTPFSAGMSKGKLVISLALPSLASGVSGRLQPGDVVTVMAVPKASVNQSLGTEPESGEKAASGVVIYPELKYLEICMVTASDGSDADVQAEPGKDEKNTLPATVSLFVTEMQAMKLVELEQTDTIQLVFVARGKDVSKYIPDSQRVLNMEVN